MKWKIFSFVNLDIIPPHAAPTAINSIHLSQMSGPNPSP